jgi:hypothetical protein
MLSRALEPEVMDTEEEEREYDAMDHGEPNAAFVARLVAELGLADAEVVVDTDRHMSLQKAAARGAEA